MKILRNLIEFRNYLKEINIDYGDCNHPIRYPAIPLNYKPLKSPYYGEYEIKFQYPGKEC